VFSLFPGQLLDPGNKHTEGPSLASQPLRACWQHQALWVMLTYSACCKLS
jgi:hypothetical protein